MWRLVPRAMTGLLLTCVPMVGLVLTLVPILVEAQSVEEVFRRINPSVVVIKAKGREVSGG